MTYVCALCFSSLVQMIFRNVVCGDIALINTITQLHIAFCTLELYCSFYLLIIIIIIIIGETWHQNFCYKVYCLLCCVSSLVGSWKQFTFPIMWSETGTLPASCVRSLTNVILNCCCDIFEAQMSRKWKNSFIVLYQVWLPMVQLPIVLSDLST